MPIINETTPLLQTFFIQPIEIKFTACRHEDSPCFRTTQKKRFHCKSCFKFCCKDCSLNKTCKCCVEAKEKYGDGSE